MTKNPNPKPTQTALRSSRTRAQCAADRLAIEQWALRGKTTHQIAALLSAQRPERTRVIRKTVQTELRSLELEWRKHALALRSAEKARALRELDEIRAKAWDGWERSKQLVTRRSKPGRPFVAVSRDGDPAYLRVLLLALERRAALLGLNAPTKAELAGPDDMPIPVKAAPLTDAHYQAILDRHIARMAQPAAPLPNSDSEQVGLEPGGNGHGSDPDRAAEFAPEPEEN